jgi:hypothetical protein
MNRERAETHLRLLAEAELRRVMAMPVGSIPDRWHSARLASVAQALTAVGAVGADVANEIQAHVRLAVAARHRLDPHWPPGPGRTRPAPPPASWRVVPVGQLINIQTDDLRRDLPLVAYVQSAGGARLIVTEWPFSPFTFTAAPIRAIGVKRAWEVYPAVALRECHRAGPDCSSGSSSPLPGSRRRAGGVKLERPQPRSGEDERA